MIELCFPPVALSTDCRSICRFSEEHPKKPISPYGRTKLAIEWMLEDYHRAYGLRSASLRYFNAAGCEPQAGLGEDHTPETHLIPNVVRYALKFTDELVIFGNDYPTPDGTCIRDYIHVTDLAEAHLKALDKLDEVGLIRLNLGTGTGYSNLQVMETVGRIAGKDLSPKFGPRRPGDPPELVADASEAGRGCYSGRPQGPAWRRFVPRFYNGSLSTQAGIRAQVTRDRPHRSHGEKCRRYF